MRVYLNSQYAVRNEINCSYLVKMLERREHRILKNDYDRILAVTPIPPIIGYILEVINGNILEETIIIIHQYLNIEKNIITKFIMKLIDNKLFLKMNFLSYSFLIPPYLLTRIKNKGRINTMNEFSPLKKFIIKRPSFPLFLSLMITSKCKTDCVYCYADRSRKDDLETETIIQTINQAHEGGVLYMNISGGDVFAIKDWRKIMQKLFSCGYHPYISTKIPLNENDIVFLKKIGVKSIQFSIDSFNPEELNLIVRRDKKYIENVIKTFELLEKYGILLRVRSVITNKNSSIESLEKTLRTIERFKDNIEHWDITPAFFSEFRGEYDNYQPDNESLKRILNYLTTVETDIIITKKSLKNKLNSKNKEYRDIKDFVCNNKKCIANTYSMYIISNGKATLCELLYYNQDFYTGDINNNTIKEIWNSEYSLRLFSPKKSDFVNNEGNPCYTCKEFDNCKTQNGKTICYVDIIKAYGSQKYDYPDPRCPKAPKHNSELLLY